jgi:photosystem II stability/assembly factor-like uncharacterized protein
VRISRISLFVALTLGTPSSAWPWGLTSMRLLAPNVGWATTGDYYARNLFWTVDGGAHWKNIAPKPLTNSETRISAGFTPSRPEYVANVFFLDTHRGWVLLCCGDASSKQSPQYDVAMTTDAGATWSIAHVKIPPNARFPRDTDNYHGEIAFTDFRHGWISLTYNASHGCRGNLLSTSDGGRTWRAPSDDYVSDGPFCLIGPAEGWQLNPPGFFDDQGDLTVTSNGAKSWKPVSAPFPKQMLPADVSQLSPTTFFHDLPTFEDRKHGFLPVTYLVEPLVGNSAIVLFETVNGGRTWKPVRFVTDLYIAGVNESYTVAVADSTLIVAAGSRDDKRVTLSSDGPDGRTETDITNYVGGWHGITYLTLSFATPKQGWMAANGGLRTTTDGGVTWTKLTPGVDSEK